MPVEAAGKRVMEIVQPDDIAEQRKIEIALARIVDIESGLANPIARARTGCKQRVVRVRCPQKEIDESCLGRGGGASFVEPVPTLPGGGDWTAWARALTCSARISRTATRQCLVIFIVLLPRRVGTGSSVRGPPFTMTQRRI